MYKPFATALACAVLIATSTSFAQQAEVPPPPPVRTERAPSDAVRLRSGFGVHGGIVQGPVAAGQTAVGGLFGLSLRLGVQFSHLLALYYQGMPEVMAMGRTGDASVQLAGYLALNNSVLVGLTLLDVLDLGVGPSLDWVGAVRCGASTQNTPGCDTHDGVHWGAHGRVSLLLGGRAGHDVRRSGLALSVDLHSTWLDDGLLLTATGGIGAEWY